MGLPSHCLSITDGRAWDCGTDRSLQEQSEVVDADYRVWKAGL